jgi:UDP-2,3-diacylglucosamine pyrophosphatase LpxH
MAIVRKAYVISDLHLGGAFGNTEDPNDRGFRLCTQVPALTHWVDELARQPVEGPQIELIINGDVVDFLAEGEDSHPASTPFVSNGRQAAEKLETIISRDRLFFAALSRFLDRGHRLVVLLGNHDIELALPDVRRTLVNKLSITGRHDFQFIYDGEAYAVGDALIEHGNRYDPWNTVDHNSLRELRSWQSRNQESNAYHAFTSSPGSRLVCDVMNPIKASYRFVDLLKPETGAVIPLLLALEPGYRSFLRQAAWLRGVALPHRMPEPARPQLSGDIAASGASAKEYGGDLAATPRADRKKPSVDPLQATLEHIMPGEAARFLATIDEERNQGTPGSFGLNGGDIASTRDTINRACGLIGLLAARDHEQIDRRLPALLRAVRVLQGDRTFDRDVETLPEYLDAARALSKGGFRFVLFGHTHLARNVPMGCDATYLNTGTWTDLIRFPQEIVGGSEAHALEALRAFVLDIAAGRLTGWVSFTPTYVRLDVDDSGRVACAELIDALRSNSF